MIYFSIIFNDMPLLFGLKFISHAMYRHRIHTQAPARCHLMPFIVCVGIECRPTGPVAKWSSIRNRPTAQYERTQFRSSTRKWHRKIKEGVPIGRYPIDSTIASFIKKWMIHFPEFFPSPFFLFRNDHYFSDGSLYANINVLLFRIHSNKSRFSFSILCPKWFIFKIGN